MDRSWPFLSGCQTAELKLTTTTDTSHTTFLFFVHHNTHKTDRQTDLLTHNTDDKGSIFGQRRRGHGNAHFFLVWFISWGSTHHTHHTRFLW